MIPPLASQITEALRRVDQIRAVFLGGSHGTGTADAYSDIDFVVVAEAGLTDDIAALWRDTLSDLGQLVLWRDRSVAPTLINAILAPDMRVDALVLQPTQLGRHTQDGVQVLLDRDALYDTLPPSPPAPQRDIRRHAYQFEEFIRVLALLPLVVGRQEFINGVTGLTHLRRHLIDLLIAEAGIPYRGGALVLNPRLTPAQQRLLTDLPPLIPTRDGVIEAHRAYAAAYLPRARAFAKAEGIDWPAAFEDATLTNLHQTLGLKIY